MSIYIRDLKNPKLVEFDKLNKKAKDIAIADVLEVQFIALNEKIEDMRQQIHKNIHLGINNRNSFKRIKNDFNLLKKLQDRATCESFILGNICQFTPQGNYVTYSKRYIND